MSGPTVQQTVASTYFVLIGCRQSELGRIVRELQSVRCERSRWRRWSTHVHNNFASSVQLSNATIRRSFSSPFVTSISSAFEISIKRAIKAHRYNLIRFGSCK